jgi:hypothetical protein
MKGTLAPPSSSVTAASICAGRAFNSAASWWVILCEIEVSKVGGRAAKN